MPDRASAWNGSADGAARLRAKVLHAHGGEHIEQHSFTYLLIYYLWISRGVVLINTEANDEDKTNSEARREDKI